MNRKWLLLLIPLVIFCGLALPVALRQPAFFDIPVMEQFGDWRTPLLDHVFRLITDLGSSPVVVGVMLVGAGVLLVLRRYWAAAFLTASVIGAGILDGLLKLVFQNPRPTFLSHLVEENGYGFPSGHSMVSGAIAVAVIFLLWNTRWRWLGLGFGIAYALAVGASRVYLGVHYPSDVVGAWCASLVWVGILFFGIIRLRRDSR